MASQLLLTYHVGRITEDQLEVKTNRINWIIKSKIALESENDLTVFELPRKTTGIVGNTELIEKIEKVISGYFNEKKQDEKSSKIKKKTQILLQEKIINKNDSVDA